MGFSSEIPQNLYDFLRGVIGNRTNYFNVTFTAFYSEEHAQPQSLDIDTGEDLPDPNNRVCLKGDKTSLEYTDNNSESFARLVDRWLDVLKSINTEGGSSYYHSKFPPRWVAHQCGTCRFSTAPKTSVLDPDCRTHGIDNLYVVDGSFFPSNIGSNSTLTIIANALRAGDVLTNQYIYSYLSFN